MRHCEEGVTNAHRQRVAADGKKNLKRLPATLKRSTSGLSTSRPSSPSTLSASRPSTPGAGGSGGFSDQEENAGPARYSLPRLRHAFCALVS